MTDARRDRSDSLLIRSGLVYDGFGNEGAVADVLIRDGRIDAVAPGLRCRDVPELAADGLAVCPGFIDLHSHSDLILTLPAETRRRLQRGKLMQGITTEISGNCGLGAAPITASSRGSIRSVLSWMTPAGTTWQWDGFYSYLRAVETTPLPMNAAFLAAHGPIRAAVLGMGAVHADGDSLAQIQNLVREGLDAGALGLSTGLIYPPGMHADTDELATAARPLARTGGIFTSHVRGSSETLLPAVEELLEIGRQVGCPVHHSHSEAVGPDHWHKIGEVLEKEDEARARGVRVTFDLFPYHAAATMMFAIFPPWALEGGPPRLLERLSVPEERARIRKAVESQAPRWPPWRPGGWPHNLVMACGYERILIARTGGRTKGLYDGLSLAALGKARRSDPFEAIADLMVEEEGEVGQLIFGITGDEENEAPMIELVRSPYGAIATDACDYGTGLPHPAAYGTFPRVLARYVRERRVLTWPEAIRRMTSLPASIAGLSRRGGLAPGFAADLVVFDPEKIVDRASFEDPRREAVGVRHVLVNGVPAVRKGAPTGFDAGVVLKRG